MILWMLGLLWIVTFIGMPVSAVASLYLFFIAHDVLGAIYFLLLAFFLGAANETIEKTTGHSSK